MITYREFDSIARVSGSSRARASESPIKCRLRRPGTLEYLFLISCRNRACRRSATDSATGGANRAAASSESALPPDGRAQTALRL